MTPDRISLTPAADEQARTYVFKRMLAEGRARIVQYQLPKPSLDVWLEHTAPDRAWLAAIRADEQLAAAAWFTDFTGKTAFAHFVIFRGYEHISRQICHLACQWAFASAVGDSLTDEDSSDSGGLACLLGVIPAVNRAAIATMRASGWQEIFRIPQACFVHRLGRHVDGVLCHFTPKLLREAMQ